jgi:hypothetical protein
MPGAGSIILDSFKRLYNKVKDALKKMVGK